MSLAIGARRRRTGVERQVASRRRLERRLLIVVPFLTSLVFNLFFFQIDKLIALVAGSMVVAWLTRRPGDALRWFVVLLPVSTLCLSLLYELGVPFELVRPLGFWKEAFAASIIVAGFTTARRERHRLDALDRVALAYVGLAVLFVVLPGVLVDGPGAQIPFGNRINGFRTDAMYIALLLGARHARISAPQVARAARAFVAVAVAAAAVSFYEFFFSGSWNTIVNEWIGLTAYKLEVLDVVPGTDPTLFDVRIYSIVAGRDVLRLGGILVDYQQFAYLLVIAAALLTELQVRRSGRIFASVALPLLGAGVLFTQTRSAVLALGLVLLLVLRRERGRSRQARVRFALVVGALAAVAIPVVFSIGLSERLSGDEESDEAHSTSSSAGVSALFERPLGRGLATAANAGQRDPSPDTVISENQFLQIGTQLGLLGLGLWVAVYVLAVVALGRAVGHAASTRGPPGFSPPSEASWVAAGARLAFVAFVPAMFLLQIHIWFATAWSHWALAGAALGALEARRADERMDDAATPVRVGP